ncbi:unnamed protein product [Vicia faba]|uniref:MATH domain-containing protein n=1 Tax=Vicia faba TaxID=3906 RepID=A0AAV0ZEI9_VICFA|nr:unnamed protein product [Vicia faba]
MMVCVEFKDGDSNIIRSQCEFKLVHHVRGGFIVTYDARRSTGLLSKGSKLRQKILGAHEPYGWGRYAQFSLAIVNQIHNKFSVRKDTQHQFNARESDRGFISFTPLGELYDPSRDYLVNDILIIEAEVLVQRVVYHIPTTENDMPFGSIPLALQILLYKLQYNDSSVSTKELTKSFNEIHMIHSCSLMSKNLTGSFVKKLEGKMKVTVVEGTIQNLFEGHHMNYIECINVDYKSTRKESFYDLHLDVKGCRDVYGSFDKYVEFERLEGDNKYQAEQDGLQDAKKDVLFIDFPPVSQLRTLLSI